MTSLFDISAPSFFCACGQGSKRRFSLRAQNSIVFSQRLTPCSEIRRLMVKVSILNFYTRVPVLARRVIAFSVSLACSASCLVCPESACEAEYLRG